MTENSNKPLKDSILKAIEAGSVNMRPKWHFILKAGLLFFGTILLVLALLFVLSFIIFILHVTGIWFVPGFGLRGLGVFVFSLPWILILTSFIFIVILEILVKHYSFGYRKPLLYSSLGIIVFVLAGGFIVAATPLHRGLFEKARKNSLPIGGGFYRQFGLPGRQGNFAAGLVTQLNDSGFEIKSPKGEVIEIIVNGQTEFPTGSDIGPDDRLVILGQGGDSSVTASSVRKIDDNDFFFLNPTFERQIPSK
jgi:hypothetical protein